MVPLSLILYSSLSSLLICFLLSLLRCRRPGSRLPPGPKPWPIIGNLPQLGAVPHHSLAAMARVYGPLMHLRLGFVDVVVAASASVAAQFLKTHDANFSSRPPNSGAKYIAYNYHDLVFAPYGPRWRMLRKITQTHLFSGKVLDDYRHVRQEEVAALVRTLGRGGERPVNLGQLLNVCTTNALARVMLGEGVFVDGGDPRADEFKAMVLEVMVLAGVFNIGDFIPQLEWLDLQGVAKKMKNLHKRFDKFLSEILKEHKMKLRNGGKKNSDMLSTLICLQEEGGNGDEGKLTDTEIKALLLNMFAAGTDTTSSTVEWALAELIRHPDILARAQRELDSVVGRTRLVTDQDLPNLPYLQSIVKETFRLHPSTPLSLPRIAAERCVIDGYEIPKHSTLLVNVWAIARDPGAWEEPLEFRPERFEKTEVDVRGNHFEVIPFGAGRRICAGMNLGLKMVTLLTAALAQGFEWEVADGAAPDKLNMEEAYGLTLQRKVPLMVHPRPRLDLRVYQSSY